MTFRVIFEKKDLEIIAWLLQTRSKTHMQVFRKAIVMALIVTCVLAYDVFFYEMRTTAQWVILLILDSACVIKAVFAYKKVNRERKVGYPVHPSPAFR